MNQDNRGPDLRKRTPEEIAAEIRRKEEYEFKKSQRKADLAWLMADKRGRRIVNALLNQGGIMGSTLVNGHASDVLEGRRSLAREIAEEIIAENHGPYLTMLTEALNDASKA